MLGFPTMISSVPPLMILSPATFPFGVQIPPPLVRCTAVFTSVMDRLIEPYLRFFNGVLAFRSVFGVRSRRGCKKHERSRH
jgi:hypothetical protein